MKEIRIEEENVLVILKPSTRKDSICFQLKDLDTKEIFPYFITVNRIKKNYAMIFIQFPEGENSNKVYLEKGDLLDHLNEIVQEVLDLVSVS